MTDRCLGDEELAGLEGLPADDPRSRHVEACPRCRARLRSYREFMAEAEPPASPREYAARAAVSAALDREILGAEPRGASAPRRTHRRAWWNSSPFFAPRWAPVLRPALAAAAVVLVAFGVMQLARQPGEGGPSGVLRGRSADGSAAVTAARVVLPDGRTAVSWKRLPGADGYQVVLFGADLVELGRVEVADDSLMVLTAGRLPAAANREPALSCRVVAQRGGDEIARSNLVPLGPVSR